MANTSLIPVLDEQVAVGFTGKVNVLRAEDRGLEGSISLSEGEVVNANFKGASGMKGFFNACVEAFDDEFAHDYIVEPERISPPFKIHYPYSVLRRKVAEVIALYKENKHLRPPGELKLLVSASFIEAGGPVNGEEFELLRTISDYSRVKDIYKNSQLPDYQITNGLVSLRKKKAITTVKSKRLK